jgi:hypothetical protein
MQFTYLKMDGKQETKQKCCCHTNSAVAVSFKHRCRDIKKCLLNALVFRTRKIEKEKEKYVLLMCLNWGKGDVQFCLCCYRFTSGTYVMQMRDSKLWQGRRWPIDVLYQNRHHKVFTRTRASMHCCGNDRGETFTMVCL